MVGFEHKIVLNSGRFTDTSRENLSAAFEAFRSTRQDDPLVLHFHGGLVGKDAAEALASRLLPEYRSVNSWPIFVIWRTHILETISNNWREFISLDVFTILLERVLQIIVGRLDQQPGQKNGLLHLPERTAVRAELRRRNTDEEPYSQRVAELQALNPDLSAIEQGQFESLLTNDPKFTAAVGHLVQTSGDKLAPQLKSELEEAQAANQLGEKGSLTALAVGAGITALFGALRRFRTGRDHGIYPTVVEEVTKAISGNWLGTTIWGHMKQDARDAFAGDDAFNGGTALLAELATLRRDGIIPRVVLVGHSAGAIFVCELLKAAARSQLDPSIKFEVIFLAPACTFRLLDDTLTLASQYLSSFRCFAMRDELERQDRMLGAFYPRSLLYFVSGTVEDEADEPLVGMERFHSMRAPFEFEAFPGIKRVLECLAKQDRAWIWSITDSEIAGTNTAAQTHGSFDEDQVTIASIKHMIQHGAHNNV